MGSWTLSPPGCGEPGVVTIVSRDSVTVRGQSKLQKLEKISISTPSG